MITTRIPRELESVVNSNGRRDRNRDMNGRKQRKQMRKGIPFVMGRERQSISSLEIRLISSILRGRIPLFAVPRGTFAPPLRVLETKNANEKREKKKETKKKWQVGGRSNRGEEKFLPLFHRPLPSVPIASLAILLARICNKGRQSREIRLIACSRDREPLPGGLLIAYLRLQSLVWPYKTPGVVSRTVEWIADGEKYKK